MWRSLNLAATRLHKNFHRLNNYHQSLKIAARQPTKRLVDFGYSLFYT